MTVELEVVFTVVVTAVVSASFFSYFDVLLFCEAQPHNKDNESVNIKVFFIV